MSSTDFVVPRGLLITETDPGRRLHAEQSLLKANFPTFTFVRAPNGQLRVRGILNTNLRNAYPVRVEIPADYPHRIPAIYPDGWDASCPHIYVDGNLCIMRPDQWRSFYSLAFVVGKTALWLNKFEVYKANGRWPGHEQRH